MNKWPNVVEVRSYSTTIVLELDGATIEGLRRP